MLQYVYGLSFFLYVFYCSSFFIHSVLSLSLFVLSLMVPRTPITDQTKQLSRKKQKSSFNTLRFDKLIPLQVSPHPITQPIMALSSTGTLNINSAYSPIAVLLAKTGRGKRRPKKTRVTFKNLSFLCSRPWRREGLQISSNHCHRKSFPMRSCVPRRPLSSYLSWVSDGNSPETWGNRSRKPISESCTRVFPVYIGK